MTSPRIHEHGRRIRNANTRKLLNALAIPPAWTGVWICPGPTGHIQATARDARWSVYEATVRGDRTPQ